MYTVYRHGDQLRRASLSAAGRCTDNNQRILSAFLARTGRTLAPRKFPLRPPPAYDSGMSIELIVAGILGVFLFVYLVYSIVRPEKF